MLIAKHRILLNISSVNKDSAVRMLQIQFIFECHFYYTAILRGHTTLLRGRIMCSAL